MSEIFKVQPWISKLSGTPRLGAFCYDLNPDELASSMLDGFFAVTSTTPLQQLSWERRQTGIPIFPITTGQPRRELEFPDETLDLAYVGYVHYPKYLFRLGRIAQELEDREVNVVARFIKPKSGGAEHIDFASLAPEKRETTFREIVCTGLESCPDNLRYHLLPQGDETQLLQSQAIGLDFSWHQSNSIENSKVPYYYSYGMMPVVERPAPSYRYIPMMGEGAIVNKDVGIEAWIEAIQSVGEVTADRKRAIQEKADYSFSWERVGFEIASILYAFSEARDLGWSRDLSASTYGPERGVLEKQIANLAHQFFPEPISLSPELIVEEIVKEKNSLITSLQNKIQSLTKELNSVVGADSSKTLVEENKKLLAEARSLRRLARVHKAEQAAELEAEKKSYREMELRLTNLLSQKLAVDVDDREIIDIVYSEGSYALKERDLNEWTRHAVTLAKGTDWIPLGTDSGLLADSADVVFEDSTESVHGVSRVFPMPSGERRFAFICSMKPCGNHFTGLWFSTPGAHKDLVEVFLDLENQITVAHRYVGLGKRVVVNFASQTNGWTEICVEVEFSEPLPEIQVQINSRAAAKGSSKHKGSLNSGLGIWGPAVKLWRSK
ncbi:hypothetical protein [Rubellicoccus peritrichatus]|uniref:Uncharacterized protein n=1 Tax=Rubellicoccus peritrichatus TaxID=3080537 RepID=A0AAQ3QV18_9BACT|nr:hypothetical protein [Puniceicoccus sp. CR14]WOO43006.1 hypothetical protein RZN69_07865 [Puniceicoccus sp. CR14]